MGFKDSTESLPLDFSESVHSFLADSSVEIKPIIYDEFQTIKELLQAFQGPAKFHLGMLTISLFAGLGYGGYVTYNCWREKNVFLSHIRNLVIALTCRTFFSILFDGVIILNSPLDVQGGNTLLSFECICLNLVVAFWLTFTIYIHARVQRNFNSEPSLILYMFGVPGVAVYFALVWVFAMEGTYSSQIWWLILFLVSFYQWMVNSIRLLYLLIQLALVIDIGRMMMVKSSDNDSVSLMRKIAVMMISLILLFWLQFGFNVGRPSLNNPQPYLYFYYFIDGTQCVLVCVVLFFFNKWVPKILDKLANITMESGETLSTSRPNDEVLIRGGSGKGIVTIDSLFMTKESEKWTNVNSKEREDVVYSSVVEPQALQKTINLYKRLNIISANKVTVVQGEEFYDCNIQNDFKKSDSLLLKRIRNMESNKKLKVENRVREKLVKKNAFYSSKYLVVNPKEDIPKYLETRPWGNQSERESSNSREHERDPSTSLKSLRTDVLVKKWLTDHTDDMEGAVQKQKRVFQYSIEKKEEALQNTLKSRQEHRPSVSETVMSTVDSVITEVLFPPKEKRNAHNDSEILEAPSHKNSEEKDTTNSQLRIETNSMGQEQYLGDEKQNIETLNMFEENHQSNEANNFEPKESMSEENGINYEIIKHVMAIKPEHNIEEQNTTGKEIDPSPNNVKDGDRRKILEDPKSECTSSSESSLTETTPVEKNKALNSTKSFPIDIEAEVTSKDGRKPIRETEIDITSEMFTQSDLFYPEKGSDLENANDLEELSSSKSTTDTSKVNDDYLTYSDLVDFRSQSNKQDKENESEGNIGFSILSAISSMLSVAINYGGSFFRSKNEDSQFK